MLLQTENLNKPELDSDNRAKHQSLGFQTFVGD